MTKTKFKNNPKINYSTLSLSLITVLLSQSKKKLGIKSSYHRKSYFVVLARWKHNANWLVLLLFGYVFHYRKFTLICSRWKEMWIFQFNRKCKIKIKLKNTYMNRMSCTFYYFAVFCNYYYRQRYSFCFLDFVKYFILLDELILPVV